MRLLPRGFCSSARAKVRTRRLTVVLRDPRSGDPCEGHAGAGLECGVSAPPPPFTVQLKRSDFLLYTWAVALRRPVLPFFLYSFTLLALLGLTGVWPGARVFSVAVSLPLLLYVLWIYLAALLLWARYPALQKPRRYTFMPDGYRLEVAESDPVVVPYDEVRELFTVRRALYLLRRDGSADLLPRAEAPEGLESFLSEKVPKTERSSFL